MLQPALTSSKKEMTALLTRTGQRCCRLVQGFCSNSAANDHASWLIGLPQRRALFESSCLSHCLLHRIQTFCCSVSASSICCSENVCRPLPRDVACIARDANSALGHRSCGRARTSPVGFRRCFARRICCICALIGRFKRETKDVAGPNLWNIASVAGYRRPWWARTSRSRSWRW